MNDKLLTVLESLTATLKEFSKKNDDNLGWSDRPPNSRKWVYIKQEGTALCYTLDKNKDRQPILESCLTGYIEGFEITEVERRGDLQTKLNIFVDCGEQKYALTVGFDTYFARNFLARLANLTKADLQKPITIMMRPGESSGVIWCYLYTDYSIQPVEDSEEVILRACNNLFEQDFPKSNYTPDVKKGTTSEPKERTNPVSKPTTVSRTSKPSHSHSLISGTTPGIYPQILIDMRSLTGHTYEEEQKLWRKFKVNKPSEINESALKRVCCEIAVAFGENRLRLSRDQVLSGIKGTIGKYPGTGWQFGIRKWLESSNFQNHQVAMVS